MNFRIIKFLLVCLQIILVQSVENASLSETPSDTTTIKIAFTDLSDLDVKVPATDEEKVINYNSTDPGKSHTNTAEYEDTKSEIESIFNGQNDFNSTEGYPKSTNIGLKENINNNVTLVNDTINPQARISEENDDNSSNIGPGESAGILAGVVVLIGIAGYIGFVVWRRYLQFKYGNSEMLITDDVYDITDLRYFEI